MCIVEYRIIERKFTGNTTETIRAIIVFCYVINEKLYLI